MKYLLTKLKLIMRASTIIIGIVCMTTGMLFASKSDGQSIRKDKVSLAARHSSLESVFREIERKTNYRFAFKSSDIQPYTSIEIQRSNRSIAVTLDQLLAITNLTYRQEGAYIYILPKPTPPSLQEIGVSGKVLDEKGETMPGISIKAKPSGRSASTDQNGNFNISLVKGDSLSFSFMGYETQTLAVDGPSSGITIHMIVSKSNSLDEVVVVGYGTQRKIQTLGAQAGLNVAELKQPVADISTVLAGRISGLVGVQRGAEPGLDGADIWIRGFNTLSNSKPLILVDGVQRDFSNIDPNDIQSFNILKDASSTSVYGVRGANGVILITTKKGKALAKPAINIDFYQGITEFTRVPQMANGVTYMQMANEANVTRGNSPIYSEDAIQKTASQEDPYLYPDVNWIDEIFNRFGNNRKANLSIQGGGERMNYYVSAGYYDEKGLFKTDELQKYNSEIAFKRYNFTSALTVQATKTTQLDLGIKGWISNGNYPGSNTDDIFAAIFNVYPILYPVRYPNGTEPFVETGGGLHNPYGLLTNRGYTTTYENQILSDIQVKQKLDFVTQGLSARILYSFDATNSNRLERTKIPYTYHATGRDENGELIYERTDQGNGQDYLEFNRNSGGSRQFYLEAAINYDRKFGNHMLTGLFLYNQSDKVSATAGDLLGSIPYRSRGIVGRASYSYNDRYLAELSFGYNGAENFAPERRYGFFPSYAIGWVPSNEKFWGNLKNTIQLLKLRASYGLVGSGDINGRRFAYIATVANTNGYSYGKDRTNNIGGLDIGDYASNVSWETEKNTNIGLEVTTLNNSLNVMIDIFKRRRENIFLQRASVPASVGLRSNPLGNLGITSSKGIDMSADYNRMWGDFGMTFKGTFTYNQNKLLENDEPAKPYPYMEKRGHRLYQRFGYIAEGYYTQEEIDDPAVARTAGIVQAGDLKFKDLNGDGVIDGNDQTAIGLDQVPQIIYGFGFTAAYKGFSLGAFFQGTARTELYLSTEFMPFRQGGARYGLYENITDRWTEENPRQDAFYPRLSYGDINQNYSAQSSHWVQNGRFLRMKTLDFGYTFSGGIFKNFGVNTMRLYFIGYNLLTFSPFKMFDPELGEGAGNRYPNIKTYSLGLNVTF